MLANQILRRIEFILSKNIIHADIQPGNLLMGVGRTGNTVYLTDFGIACPTRNDQTHSYATLRERLRSADCTLHDNPPFASLMGHVGGGSTPRSLHHRMTLTLIGLGRCRADDLESLAMSLFDFSLALCLGMALRLKI